MAQKAQKVTARIIFQIAGTPKEYVEEMTHKLVESIKKIETYEVTYDEIFETEEKEKVFSSFAEMEIKFANYRECLNFCIDFQPSSVEIVEPKHVNMQLFELNALLNDLLAALLQKNLTLKTLESENKFIKKNFNITLKNYISTLLRLGPLNLIELTKLTGIPEKEAELFLEHMEKENIIEKKEDKYFFKKKN